MTGKETNLSQPITSKLEKLIWANQWPAKNQFEPTNDRRKNQFEPTNDRRRNQFEPTNDRRKNQFEPTNDRGESNDEVHYVCNMAIYSAEECIELMKNAMKSRGLVWQKIFFRLKNHPNDWWVEQQTEMGSFFSSIKFRKWCVRKNSQGFHSDTTSAKRDREWWILPRGMYPLILCKVWSRPIPTGSE